MGRDPREAGREGTEGGRSGRRVPGSGPASAKVLRQKRAQCVCRTGRRPVGLGQSECQGSRGGLGASRATGRSWLSLGVSHRTLRFSQDPCGCWGENRVKEGKGGCWCTVQVSDERPRS